VCTSLLVCGSIGEREETWETEETVGTEGTVGS